MRSEDFRHRYFREPEARVFRPVLFEKLYNEGCGVYLRLVMLYRRWMLEEQMRWFWEFQQASESLFFCMPTCLNVSFLKQIENKQPVQISFRYVYRESSFFRNCFKAG
jgi:hypothetical protein